MKLHIGTTDDNSLVYSHVVTPTNEHDITATDKILHGEGEKVYGYIGVGKRKDMCEDDILQKTEKASICAKVEHPFLYVKRIFDYGNTLQRRTIEESQPLGAVIRLFQLAQSGEITPFVGEFA